MKLFQDQYRGKKVFLTGHTGFKGSWMHQWLIELGAEVYGYALAPNTSPSHYEELGQSKDQTIADIRELDRLKAAMKSFNPDIVFHLAAQPLVRDSYHIPLETFETNIMGSLNVYEAAKETSSVKVVVTITTDKVYKNKEWERGYKEDDELGGLDPYSASKAAMELVTHSYKKSFFEGLGGEKRDILLSCVRAGNVIGGGDWAKDRLIPDIVRGIASGETITIRNPQSTRPWQHVLEPISGYLHLGAYLLAGKEEFATPFNFGPAHGEVATVAEIIKLFESEWPGFKVEMPEISNKPHEANLLQLDSTKAKSELGWRPVWDCAEAIQKTAAWYRNYYQAKKLTTQDDIFAYVEKAKQLKLPWVE